MSWHFLQHSVKWALEVIVHEKVHSLRFVIRAEEEGTGVLLTVMREREERVYEIRAENWSSAWKDIREAYRQGRIHSSLCEAPPISGWSFDDLRARHVDGAGIGAQVAFYRSCPPHQSQQVRQQDGKSSTDDEIGSLPPAWRGIVVDQAEDKWWSVCVSLLCSLGQEEASWEDICLGGAPSALLNLLSTQEECCLPDRGTECCHASRSGTMCEPLTGSRGEERLMLSPADSLARILVSRGKAQGSPASEADCGERWREWFAKLIQNTSLWRIAQRSLFEDLEQSLAIWPRWGLMRGGECFHVQRLEGCICEKESGLSLPTLGKNEGKGSARKRYRHSPDFRGAKMSEALRTCENDPIYLNPPFAELTMMWPLGWTDLQPLGMGKFQEWQQQHGGF